MKSIIMNVYYKNSLLLFFVLWGVVGYTQQFKKIQTIYGSSSSGYGSSVASTDSIMVVGAKSRNTVDVFSLQEDGVWNKVQTILPPSSFTGTIAFGGSVDIKNNTLVIGAFLKEGGTVYVYEKNDNNTWGYIQSIKASDYFTQDYFGWSVGLEDSLLVVGSKYDDVSNDSFDWIENAGSAYVFKKQKNGQWTETQKLLSPIKKTDENFGYTVDIQSDHIVVGGHAITATGKSSSSVVIYNLISDVWEEQLVIKDVYTESVVLQNDDLFFSDVDGIIHFVKLEQNQWVEQNQTFDTSLLGGFYGVSSGRTLALSENYFLVSSLFQVAVFTQNQTEEWELVQSFSKPTNISYYGQSINTSNQYFFVGSSDYKQNGTTTGALEIFERCASFSSLKAITCDMYDFNGNVLTETGIYRDTLVNSTGCDSVITLDLTMLKSTSLTFQETVCDVYNFNGNVLTETGVYKDTLENSVGCDSVITLDLTILKASPIQFTKQTLCSNFNFNGKTLTKSGIYMDTLQNSVGCDSIVVLDLILNKLLTTISTSVCDVYDFNGNILTETGVYKDTLESSIGCDSIVVLDLIVNQVDTSVINDHSVLIANAVNATMYEWIDCNQDNLVIESENNKSLLITSSGKYALQVTKDGCVKTSDCISVEINDTSIQLEVYPNPTNDMCYLNIYGNWNGLSYQLFDVLGRTIEEKEIKQQTTNIYLGGLAQGVYFLQVKDQIVKVVYH